MRNAKMDAAVLARKENELLDEWAQKVPGFVRDGVVDPEKYCNAPIKILVVLKEVNGERVRDLREFLKEGGRSQTWNVVARWIEHIFDIEKDYHWSDLEQYDGDRRKQALQYVAAINVKKTGGKAVADNNEVFASADADKENLRKQIDLYCPDIVICGGTEKAYVKVTDAKPDWKMTARGIWYYVEKSGTTVISYSHPEARTKPCLLHFALIDAIREILAKTV